MITFPVVVGADELHFAELWHGGQWSALYSLLSTGLIHDTAHADSLDSELRQIEHSGMPLDDGHWLLREIISGILLDNPEIVD